MVDSVAAAVVALQGDDDHAKNQGLHFLWSNSLGGYGGFSASDLVEIRERGGIPPLLALLETTSDAFHVLLRLLRDDAESKVPIREAGGIPMLIELLHVAHDPSKQWDAAQLLGTLSFDDTESKVAIRQAGGIPPLLKLVNRGTGSAPSTAARALRTLASDNDDNAVAIALARGRVEAFVELARRGRVSVRGLGVVDNAGAAAKRKAALVVSALLRDFPVPRDMKAAIASYL